MSTIARPAMRRRAKASPRSSRRSKAAPSTQSTDPTSLIRVVLEGAQSAATDSAPTGPAMPAFDWKLSDAQVAAVVTYVRNSWGNAAPIVSAGDVQRARRKLAQSND